MTAPGQRLVDYAAAATYLGLPVGTLRSMVSRRQIPHVRLSARRDPVRAQLGRFRDSADARRRSVAGQILRSLHSGNHLTNEHLLDELEQFEAGEQVKP